MQKGSVCQKSIEHWTMHARWIGNVYKIPGHSMTNASYVGVTFFISFISIKRVYGFTVSHTPLLPWQDNYTSLVGSCVHRTCNSLCHSTCSIATNFLVILTKYYQVLPFEKSVGQYAFLVACCWFIAVSFQKGFGVYFWRWWVLSINLWLISAEPLSWEMNTFIIIITCCIESGCLATELDLVRSGIPVKWLDKF